MALALVGLSVCASILLERRRPYEPRASISENFTTSVLEHPMAQAIAPRRRPTKNCRHASLQEEMNTQHLSLDQDSMRAHWVAGDYSALARKIGVPGAEAFVARMELELGARVLDIACGTGNVTIPLARRGAMVTGLDMTPHLLEGARARAAREGLRVRLDEGFAETLPYADGSFDVLVSMFGTMFSPLPRDHASEMARVLRPGGRLALASWALVVAVRWSCDEAPFVPPNSSRRLPAQYKSRSDASTPRIRPHSCVTWSSSG